MVNKDAFAKWLETYAKLKPYSIGRYAGAIDTISSELEVYGLQDINLFNLTDATFIDTILTNPEFIKKNNKGNRMYSTALKHFKRYIEYNNNTELQAELLKEELDFDRYLLKSPADVTKGTIEDKPKDKPTHKAISNRNIWYRNPKYASEAIANAGYLCEFDNQHQHFISKFNQKNYVEAHHLVPISFQDRFDCSLDCHANIVSICLVCHKKIHHGLFEDKKELLEKLYNSRKERLRASGINITLSELYSYYQE
ncbi:HNH endonuclease [Pseudalkalibacillus sp. R45]|uniref:HNH endonuclease n=1 Tax=Pseudalkalibacillus sp. R45 TaxID=3457433 RepID=UPI003FCDBEAB